MLAAMSQLAPNNTLQPTNRNTEVEAIERERKRAFSSNLKIISSHHM